MIRINILVVYLPNGSGCIVWQQGQGKGEPWNIHHLTLHCSVDTRLWTKEGTKLVAEEKAEDAAKAIAKTREKGDLNQKQLAHIQRKNSTLARMNKPRIDRVVTYANR